MTSPAFIHILGVFNKLFDLFSVNLSNIDEKFRKYEGLLVIIYFGSVLPQC